MSDSHDARRHVDWFVRHDAEVRQLAWLGTLVAAPAASNASTMGKDEAPLSHDVAAAPAAPSPEREALEALTSKAEEMAGALDRVRADLAAALGDTAAARSELERARKAMAELATTVRDDAETELVKLAMSVAARVVARELTTAPALIVDWVREAIAGSDIGGAFVVAVSADVSSSVPDEAWLELDASLRMDPALPVATCEVRGAGRVITVSADERLELVEDHLAAVVAVALTERKAA